MRNYLCILVLAGVLSACSGFLEPQSQNEYVPQDATSLDEMLLGSAYPRTDGANLFSILPMLDDDIVCTDTAGGTIKETDGRKFISLQSLFSWQPDYWTALEDGDNFENYWENYYKYLRGVNAALDYIDDVRGTEEEKSLVKAQALALRAFYYFYLVNLFGEPYDENPKALGVPLRTTSAMENKELPRNTVEEVYGQIVEDLDEAEKLYLSLPVNLQFRRDYRTSLPMVRMLRSRVDLYMEDWTNAAVYARKVIDSPQFSLLDLNALPDSTDLEPYYNFISMETSTECIWVYGNVSTYTTYFNLLVLSVEKRYSYRFFNASPALLEAYETGDWRKRKYIVKGENKETLAGGKYVIHPSGYLPYGKFAITSEKTPTSGSIHFAHAFRLAEAYLNLAEASAFNKDEKTARWALNELREKRLTPDTYEEITDVTGQELIDLTRLERRREMCYEGHRWFDLRRYGMPAFSRTWKIPGQPGLVYQLQEKDAAYTLPIPQVVLDRNRSLKQNTLAKPR